MKLQHGLVVVQPPCQGIGKQHEGRIGVNVAVASAVPVDAGLVGKPCPPTPDIQQHRHDDQGRKSRKCVICKAAQYGAANAVAVA